METVESKYRFTVIAVTLKHLTFDPWAYSTRGNNKLIQEMCLLSKRTVTELASSATAWSEIQNWSSDHLTLAQSPNLKWEKNGLFLYCLPSHKPSVWNYLMCILWNNTADRDWCAVLKVLSLIAEECDESGNYDRQTSKNQLPSWNQHLKKPVEAFGNFGMEIQKFTQNDV